MLCLSWVLGLVKLCGVEATGSEVGYACERASRLFSSGGVAQEDRLQEGEVWALLAVFTAGDRDGFHGFAELGGPLLS